MCISKLRDLAYCLAAMTSCLSSHLLWLWSRGGGGLPAHAESPVSQIVWTMILAVNCTLCWSFLSSLLQLCVFWTWLGIASSLLMGQSLVTVWNATAWCRHLTQLFFKRVEPLLLKALTFLAFSLSHMSEWWKEQWRGGGEGEVISETNAQITQWRELLVPSTHVIWCTCIWETPNFKAWFSRTLSLWGFMWNCGWHIYTWTFCIVYIVKSWSLCNHCVCYPVWGTASTFKALWSFVLLFKQSFIFLSLCVCVW